MSSSGVSRRFFLRGAGATLLAIPSLQSLVPSHVQAAASPSRFVFMGSIYGRDIDYWYPKAPVMSEGPEGVHHADLTSIAGPISHAFGADFDPLRKKMSILRGLDSLDFDDGHSYSQPLTASGTTVTPSFGYSVDAILEESKKFYSVPAKVGAIRSSASYHESFFSYSVTSKSSYGQSVPSQWDPRKVYASFFATGAAAAADATSKRQLGLTNLVYEDFRRVRDSSGISKQDKERLENYMTLLTGVEAKLSLPTPVCSASPVPTITTNEHAQSAMIDLEVAALACGLTRIVVHAIPNVASDPALGDEPHHSAAHQNGGKPSNSETGVSQHATYDRWVMKRVAEMLRRLDAVSEADGSTLLDNTFFLYANSESRGFHTFYDMPVVVAGGQGRLATGKYIDFRPRPLTQVGGGDETLIAGRPYNNLLVTLLQGMGLSSSDYQRFGQTGFGSYGNYNRGLQEHYAPYLSDAGRNRPLPLLYRS